MNWTVSITLDYLPTFKVASQSLQKYGQMSPIQDYFCYSKIYLI